MSGVMLVVKMAPSGVPIFSPPAKALPSGAEWQATQSPARAKYSPRAVLPTVWARTGTASNRLASTAARTGIRIMGAVSGRAGQALILQRKAANPLARSGEDGVGEGW